MDAINVIKSKIKPKLYYLIVGVILIAVTIFGVIYFNSLGNSINQKDAIMFDPINSEIGVNGYIDVVGISEWIYSEGDLRYYAVEDTEGYMYIAIIRNTTYNVANDQRQYWTDYESMKMPNPLRLTGVTQLLNPTIRKDLMEANELTDEEFSNYFGDMYLNTVSNAGNTKTTFPKIILIIAFVVGVILVIYYFGGLIKSKKCLAKLQQSEYLEETAQQVEMSDYVQVGKNVALVCDKMVLFPSHHYAIAFDEIVWIYKKITKYNGIITSNTDLLLYNKDKKCVKVASVFGGDKNDYVGKLAAIISVKTPNVLVGYNKDNITLYNSYRKTGELPKPIEHPQDSMM